MGRSKGRQRQRKLSRYVTFILKNEKNRPCYKIVHTTDISTKMHVCTQSFVCRSLLDGTSWSMAERQGLTMVCVDHRNM